LTSSFMASTVLPAGTRISGCVQIVSNAFFIFFLLGAACTAQSGSANMKLLKGRFRPIAQALSLGRVPGSEPTRAPHCNPNNLRDRFKHGAPPSPQSLGSQSNPAIRSRTG
jgi:hypothetical protein